MVKIIKRRKGKRAINCKPFSDIKGIRAWESQTCAILSVIISCSKDQNNKMVEAKVAEELGDYVISVSHPHITITMGVVDFPVEIWPMLLLFSPVLKPIPMESCAGRGAQMSSLSFPSKNI